MARQHFVFCSGNAQCAAYGCCAQCSNCMISLSSLEFGYKFLEFEFLTVIIIWFQARPTMYQVVKEMIDKMGYEVCFTSFFCFPTLSFEFTLEYSYSICL